MEYDDNACFIIETFDEWWTEHTTLYCNEDDALARYDEICKKLPFSQVRLIQLIAKS